MEWMGKVLCHFLHSDVESDAASNANNEEAGERCLRNRQNVGEVRVAFAALEYKGVLDNWMTLLGLQ